MSYLGLQAALAFYLIHLSEFAPQLSLSVARDRLAGILLGLLVMWLVFDHLWAAPAALFLMPRASLRYSLGLEGSELPEAGRLALREYNERSPRMLDEVADRLEGRAYRPMTEPDGAANSWNRFSPHAAAKRENCCRICGHS